ncbi:MAG: ATP-binding protein [Cyclobacteriaceae bacterium]
MGFNRKYYAIFILTILVLAGNQIIIQTYLYKKKNDAVSINIAGRQRMLSQKLLSLCLIENEVPSELNKQALEDNFNEWQNSHLSLIYGSDSLKRITNKVIRDSLKNLTKYVDHFRQQVIEENKQPLDIAIVHQNQEIFLKKMNEIVFDLEEDSNSKLSNIVRIEILMMLLSMLVIFLEYRYFFIPISTNLNEKNHSLLQQNQTLRDYEISNQNLTRFSHIISHDLKNPVNQISSFTQLLQQSLAGKNTDDKEEAYMKFIAQSSQDLRLLIDDLVNFVSMDESKLHITQIDLNSILENIKSIFEDDIRAISGVITTNNLPEFIHADRTKIKCIFQNLISNSIKYCNAEAKLQIAINCFETKNEWNFEFSDNGQGIENDKLDDIFEIFVKHDSLDRGSTGIGLALVKNAIQKHGGTISVNSIENQGTTFSFSIPKNLKDSGA